MREAGPVGGSMLELERRKFLLATSALLSAPLVGAQPRSRVSRIGYVLLSSSPASEAFRQGLRDLGYVDGKNVIVETRSADGRPELLPGLIAEVLGSKVDILVADSTPAALAAKAATAAIPIVFAGVTDPVHSGIVANLARPGGNITGASLGMGERFAGKWVELLKETVPGISQVTVLSNSANLTGVGLLTEVRNAARLMNVKLDVVDAGDTARLEAAFAAIGASDTQGLIVPIDPFLFANRAKIAQFAALRRLPAIYSFRLYAESGGLMSYGGSLEDTYRKAATYLDRILKGAKPADLPVEQPTVFELVINLKTARALGLTIPRELLLRANVVID